MKINLNADLGESYGAFQIGNDKQLLDVVNSANVACGFHAGDPWVMTRTVELAVAKGVSIGAHPAFPDLQGFGRRALQMSPHELRAAILYQVGALDGISNAMGSSVTHIKPHGALNNMACEDAELAAVVATALREYSQELILLAPALSELAKAGEAAGLRVALELFADRAYTDDGHLAPRSWKDAVIHDSQKCVAHVMQMVEKGGITSINDKFLPTEFHSICVHGDNEESANTAAQVKEGLFTAGCELMTLPMMGL